MTQNSLLQQSVLAEFDWEPSVTAGHIGVTANAGVVTLSGHVDSYAGKHAAETAAGRVKGVKAVAEEIEVRLPIDAKRTDEEIAAAVIERLAWNTSVPKDSVLAKVEGGWVTLTGQVDFWFQKEAAGNDVRPLHGVVGVSNAVTIRPRVDVAGQNVGSVGDDITQALHRSGFFNLETIHVRSKGGKVVLTGTVHSLHERAIAGQTAWAATGTEMVENELEVV